MLAFCGDQLYLVGLEQHDAGKLELAARLFPFERDIAIGTGMLYVIISTDDRRALGAIRMAQEFDPYAADLLRGEAAYAYHFGLKPEGDWATGRLRSIRRK